MVEACDNYIEALNNERDEEDVSVDHKETNAEYHADLSHVSNSMLKVFAESPQKYYQMFVAKTMPKPEQTPSLLLGSVVHCLFLEPEKFGAEYAVAPAVDRRTKVGKETFAIVSDSLASTALEYPGARHSMFYANRNNLPFLKYTASRSDYGGLEQFTLVHVNLP